jgi:DNA-binding transcriptional regulator GbsR (MarR family)
MALSTRLQSIRDVIAVGGPMTCAEVESTTGWSHQTVSAAITVLVERGQIEVAGKVRQPGASRAVRTYLVLERDVPDHVTINLTGISQTARRVILSLIEAERKGMA